MQIVLKKGQISDCQAAGVTERRNGHASEGPFSRDCIDLRVIYMGLFLYVRSWTCILADAYVYLNKRTPRV